jgi:hypothetical protein
MFSLYEWAHRRFSVYVDCRLIRLTETLEASGFLHRVQNRENVGAPCRNRSGQMVEGMKSDPTIQDIVLSYAKEIWHNSQKIR